jgi:hypothetical protein
MTLHPDPLGIVAAARNVIERAQHVRVELRPLARWAVQLAAKPLPPPGWDVRLHYFDGTERTVNWLLLLDTLNFSFWGDPGDRWEIDVNGRTLSGYWALAGALTRAVHEGIPLWDAAVMADLSADTLAHVFRGRGVVPLFEERLAAARETGQVLRDKYGGWFTKALEEADRSAVALVRLLGRDFPSFRDVAAYGGMSVPFYKRAQILCADLHAAFGGEGWGRFSDLNALTVFADYKLPQVLREIGGLVLSDGLAARVDGKELLEAGSAEEVEVRAATIWACELLRQQVQRQGRDVPSYRLDWYLWDLSQTMELPHPHIRTRTVFY